MIMVLRNAPRPKTKMASDIIRNASVFSRGRRQDLYSYEYSYGTVVMIIIDNPRGSVQYSY